MAKVFGMLHVPGCFAFVVFCLLGFVAGEHAPTTFLRTQVRQSGGPLSPRTVRRIQSRGFGLYSYYDTLTDAANTDDLVQFCTQYNVSFVNQYSCASYSPNQFSDFAQRIGTSTNAKVRVLFDDTLFAAPGSQCQNACKRGSSTGEGWCCGSIDVKIQWMRDVLDKMPDPTYLDGANFDIEGLMFSDYLDLLRTMRGFWNDAVTSKYEFPKLRFSFGNDQQFLVSTLLKEKLLDGVYWESYESNSATMMESASSVLIAVKGMAERTAGAVLLSFETNCCAQPCASCSCTTCGTHPLPDRDMKSFGLCDPLTEKRDVRVLHLLDVLDSVEHGLRNMGLWEFVDHELTTGFVAFNYRGLHILLNGTDASTSHCPAPSL